MANQFFLHDGGGNGPSLKYLGSAFVAGQFGAWTPIGAEKVGSGYQVAWKNGSADQYIVWNLDSNGNYAGNAAGWCRAPSTTLQSLETTFQQDLNGDGTIGLKTTPIETSGATRLDQVANKFFLHDGGGSGPSLKYAGADVCRRPVRGLDADRGGEGRQRLPGGLEDGSDDQYTVWNVDSNGNYTGRATGVVSGSEHALQSLETTFQQDLNADGTIGLKTTPIETSGATHLDQVANKFFLHDGGGQRPVPEVRRRRRLSPASSGPGRRSGRRRLAAATRWPGRTAAPTSTPCGTSTATATIPAVPRAWCQAPSMRCSRWRRRSSRISTHDGTTGLKTTTIETSGATHLDQVANKFFLHDGAAPARP